MCLLFCGKNYQYTFIFDSIFLELLYLEDF